MAGEICGVCNKLIEGPKIMGMEVEIMVINGEKTLVHADCYFDLPDGVTAGRVTPHGGMRGPID